MYSVHTCTCRYTAGHLLVGRGGYMYMQRIYYNRNHEDTELLRIQNYPGLPYTSDRALICKTTCTFNGSANTPLVQLRVYATVNNDKDRE